MIIGLENNEAARAHFLRSKLDKKQKISNVFFSTKRTGPM